MHFCIVQPDRDIAIAKGYLQIIVRIGLDTVDPDDFILRPILKADDQGTVFIVADPVVSAAGILCRR